MKPISGFSKLSKQQKINYLVNDFVPNNKPLPDATAELLKSFWHKDQQYQKIFDEFSENTLTNFYSPYGVVPNVLLNDKLYCVPMVIEESSVVAACARSAKFWLERGGFKAQVLGTEKVGQVHFSWAGDRTKLFSYFEAIKQEILAEVQPLIANMEKRGGGISSIELRDKTDLEENYFQLYCVFETCDAMGANFINSILESFGEKLRSLVDREFTENNLIVIMCILSNYTPNCRVKATLSCPIEKLHDPSLEMSAELFAYKFEQAIKISKFDVNRAVTHNKGIFNGIDALVQATGNDFRAIEACGHAYAARDGQYRGLSDISLKNGNFEFSLELPLALGTVGGLTSLHPLAKFSLDMLGQPSAEELMKITATLGLAQNFAAIRSLVTSGIQKGHMKMHLLNILNHLMADGDERSQAVEFFKDKTISHNAVRDFMRSLRKLQ